MLGGCYLPADRQTRAPGGPGWYVHARSASKCLDEVNLDATVHHVFHNTLRKKKPLIVRARSPQVAGSIIAILSTDHHAVGALYTTGTTESAAPLANVHLEPFGCTCGKVHVRAVAASDIAPGQQLCLHQGPRSTSDCLLTQFDGSCHKEMQVGGAGVLVWAP